MKNKVSPIIIFFILLSLFYMASVVFGEESSSVSSNKDSNLSQPVAPDDSEKIAKDLENDKDLGDDFVPTDDVDKKSKNFLEGLFFNVSSSKDESPLNIEENNLTAVQVNEPLVFSPSTLGSNKSLTWEMFKSALALIFIILIIIFGFKALVRFGFLGSKVGASHFKLEGVLPLDNKKYLAAVTIEGRKLILGITQDKITLLESWSVMNFSEITECELKKTKDSADDSQEI